MQINHHIGRLVRPVNFRNIDDPNRTNVAYVRLAVDGMTTKQTTFLDYVAFGKIAERLSKLTMEKGDLIELQFTIQNNEYIDQATQKKVFTFQNVISRIKVYHNGKNTKQQESSTTLPTYPPEFDMPTDTSSLSADNPFADYDTFTS